jgi:pimeloyl-ACP methyl ester carboxylesterase
LRLLLALVLVFVALPAGAERLVLVQGYLGEGSSWDAWEVTPALERSGWADGGHLIYTPGGVGIREGNVGTARRYYTLELPTEGPLLVQERYLAAYLDFLETRYGPESVILAGHSAGGVVARLYMVNHPEAGIDALITIASPNLGTDRAELGALAGQTPLAWVAPFLGGGTLNRSQALYRDLAREQTGNLLFWLNRQPHPPARYISVVRGADGPLSFGDLVVPAWSQDLNQVYALRGRAVRVESPGNHFMGPEDGELLVRILNWLQNA